MTTAKSRDGYQRLFDARKSRQRIDDERLKTGDQHTGPYVYDEDEGNRIELAVNVALAAERPLLVRGVPGTGKSSLAADVARRLGWRYYEVVVSSRTQARDLQWTFDAVERLSDAQVSGAAGADGPTRLRDDAAYVRPGALWWAFDRESASRRGLTEDELRERGLRRERDPEAPKRSARAVVLVDEIDKADPDVPNDLLVPLGSFRFAVDRLKSQNKPVEVVAARAPLVIITTNEERDLPQAFLRRCITLRLEPPEDPRLKQIAKAHFPDQLTDQQLDVVVEKYRAIQGLQRDKGAREASIAEFLDAVAACIVLETGPIATELWGRLAELALDKPGNPSLG